MTLIAEMRSCRSQAFCTGVSPDGAQVRRRTGWSMKPLSSKKASGVSVSRAPFLSAANPAFATAAWRRRPTPAPAAGVFGWSSQDCEESSRRGTGDRRLAASWRLLLRPAHRSKARCGSRLLSVPPRVTPPTSVFARHSNEAWGPDAAWLSKPPCRLPLPLASNASPKIRKLRQFPSHRRLSCLPAGVVPQADGEFPTRLRFLAFS
jgi:hypothetical protein